MPNRPTRRNAFSAAGMVIATCGQALGQTTPGEHPLHGVWELLSLEDHQPGGGTTYWLGKAITGTLIYTPAGRVSLQFLGDPHPKFTAGKVFSPSGKTLLPAASNDEIRTAYAGYYAYSGTYDFDETKRTVTHHIQASLRPHEIGLTYTRPFELSGDSLVLRMPVPDDHGGTNTRIIAWRKAESFRKP